MNKWQKLQRDISVWQREQFGEYGPVPVLHHLEQEVSELIEAWDEKDPQVIMEFADCMILLMGAAAHAGITMSMLKRAAHTKLEINKQREWGEPDENGVIQHIRKEPVET